MDFPLDQVEGVCGLSTDEAISLHASAREGNLAALAEWTCWTLYRKFRSHRLSHVKSVSETKSLLSRVNLQLRIVE